MSMLKYIIKRLGLMLLTLFIIQTMLFFLVRCLPVQITCAPGTDTCETLKVQREAMGFNRPLAVQWWIYLRSIITFTYKPKGYNMYTGQGVYTVLFAKMPNTMFVNFLSLILAIPLGLVFGVIAALKKNKWQDQVISVLVMLVISVPSFVYAFLIQWLWTRNPSNPAVVYAFQNIGVSYVNGHLMTFWDVLYSYLPAILCLSLGVIAGLTRFTRAELTEVLTSDFMLLARAKGMSRRQATIKHAMRNAMVPIIPSIMGEFIGIIGGSLIIEQFFAIPGVGKLYLQSIQEVDYFFFLSLSMFYVIIGLLSGLIIDMSYGWVDPRIRMGAK